MTAQEKAAPLPGRGDQKTSATIAESIIEGLKTQDASQPPVASHATAKASAIWAPPRPLEPLQVFRRLRVTLDPARTFLPITDAPIDRRSFWLMAGTVALEFSAKHLRGDLAGLAEAQLKFGNVNVVALRDRTPIDSIGRSSLLVRERVLAVIDDRCGHGPEHFDPNTLHWLLTEPEPSLFAVWSARGEHILLNAPCAPEQRIARKGRKAGGARHRAFIVLLLTTPETAADWFAHAVQLRARGTHAAR